MGHRAAWSMRRFELQRARHSRLGVLANARLDGGRAHPAGFSGHGKDRPESRTVSLPGDQRAGVHGLMDPPQRIAILSLPGAVRMSLSRQATGQATSGYHRDGGLAEGDQTRDLTNR